ncbi:hypothetical protein Tco_1482813 [Tanacetum coccineum]
MKDQKSLNVTSNESPPPTKLSPLVNDDVGKEEAIKKNTKSVNTNNEEDELIEVDKIINIKESKNHPLDQVIGKLNQRTLRSSGWKIPNQPRRRCQKIKLTKNDEADSVDSSKYREYPKTTHLEAVKRIFRYIRGTSHLGLWYPKGTRIETIVYVDSDQRGRLRDRKKH